jgi:hypothetical protein
MVAKARELTTPDLPDLSNPGILRPIPFRCMTGAITAEERRARRRRLVIILVVAAVILVGIFAVVTIKNHSLNDKADSATAELRSKWRTVDLASLRGAYDQAVVAAHDSGNYDATVRLFPQSSEASFVTADINTLGVMHATYRVDGWGGSSECLFVTAKGTTPPNRVTFDRGDSHC